MRGKLSKRANRKDFRRNAAKVNSRNIFNPRKLHKGGEIIR